MRLLLCAALVLVLSAGCGGTSRPAASGEVISVAGGTATPYGVGAGRVWILLPRKGEIRSLVVYLLPVTALLYGSLLLGETVTASALVGLMLILTGTALGSGLLRLPRRAPVPASSP